MKSAPDVDSRRFDPIATGCARSHAVLDARPPFDAPPRLLTGWLPAWWPMRRAAMSAATGRWQQQLIHASQAHLVVTLGTADGLAAVWLADALRQVGGTRGDRALIGFERDPLAARHARDVLRRAGVSRYVDVRCDAPLRVLALLDAPIDLVLLLEPFDDEAIGLLDLLLPKLRPGASLVAPRIARRPQLAAALDGLAAEQGPLQGLRLPFDGGVNWSVKR